MVILHAPAVNEIAVPVQRERICFPQGGITRRNDVRVGDKPQHAGAFTRPADHDARAEAAGHALVGSLDLFPGRSRELFQIRVQPSCLGLLPGAAIGRAEGWKGDQISLEREQFVFTSVDTFQNGVRHGVCPQSIGWR